MPLPTLTLNAVYADQAMAYLLIDLTGNTIPLNQPIWTPTLNVDYNGYSNFPALFVAEQGSTAPTMPVLDIVLNISGYTEACTFTLQGTQNKKLLFQSRPQGVGQNGPLTVKMAPAIAGINCINGAIEWTVQFNQNFTQTTVSVPSTQLELYFTFAPPLSMWHAGVWLAPLRAIFHQLNNVKSSPYALTDAITATVQQCFTSFGTAYPKMYSGNSHYFTWGSFDMWSYWNAPQTDAAISVPVPNSLPPYGCDCVTMASLLQISLGALGISSSQVSINGFGYLTTTSLVGWPGTCNNPYFMNGGPTYAKGSEMESPTSTARQPWSYHQLVQLPNGNIADATIGPHSGTETVTEYLASAVDTTAAVLPLYAQRQIAYATASSFGSIGPVSSVAALAPPPTPPAAAQPATAATTAVDSAAVNADIPAAVSQAAAKQNLILSASHVLPGPLSSLHTANFADATKKTFLFCQVFVENKASGAAARYHEILARPAALGAKAWAPGPAAVGSVSAVANGGSTVLWRHRNVVGMAGSNLPSSSLVGLVQDLISAWDASAASGNGADQAQISATTDGRSGPVGSEITVAISTTNAGPAEFSCDSERLRLVRRSSDALTFLALAPGQTTVTVFAPHVRNLIASSASVAINVTAATLASSGGA